MKEILRFNNKNDKLNIINNKVIFNDEFDTIEYDFDSILIKEKYNIGEEIKNNNLFFIIFNQYDLFELIKDLYKELNKNNIKSSSNSFRISEMKIFQFKIDIKVIFDNKIYDLIPEYLNEYIKGPKNLIEILEKSYWKLEKYDAINNSENQILFINFKMYKNDKIFKNINFIYFDFIDENINLLKNIWNNTINNDWEYFQNMIKKNTYKLYILNMDPDLDDLNEDLNKFKLIMSEIKNGRNEDYYEEDNEKNDYEEPINKSKVLKNKVNNLKNMIEKSNYENSKKWNSDLFDSYFFSENLNESKPKYLNYNYFISDLKAVINKKDNKYGKHLLKNFKFWIKYINKIENENLVKEDQIKSLKFDFENKNKVIKDKSLILGEINNLKDIISTNKQSNNDNMNLIKKELSFEKEKCILLEKRLKDQNENISKLGIIEMKKFELEEDLKNSKNQINKLLKDLVNYDELKLKLNEKDNSINNLALEIQKNEEIIKNLELTLDDYEEQLKLNEQYKNKISKVEKLFEEKNYDNSNLNKIISEQNEKIEKITKELDLLNKNFTDLKINESSKETEIKNLLTNLDEEKIKYLNLMELNKKLVKKIEVLDENVTGVKEKYYQLRNNNKFLKNDYNEKTNKIRDLEIKLDSFACKEKKSQKIKNKVKVLDDIKSMINDQKSKLIK